MEYTYLTNLEDKEILHHEAENLEERSLHGKRKIS